MSKKNPDVSFLVTEIKAACDRMTPERRAYLNDFVSQRFPPDVLQLIEELTPIPDDAGPLLKELIGNMRQTIKVGFSLALARYSRDLKANAEAMAIIGARAKGGAIGRAHSTDRSDDLARRIRAKWAEMEAAGMKVTNDTVAVAMKCSRSTVIRAFKPRKKLRRS